MFLELYIAAIVVRAVVAFIDTKNQTGSTRAGISAAGHGAADAATFGVYSAVKAISNDTLGQYYADFYANRLTLGVYGTVQAFEEGQIAGGIVGVAGTIASIVGLSRAVARAHNSLVVSGDVRKLSSALSAHPRVKKPRWGLKDWFDRQPGRRGQNPEQLQALPARLRQKLLDALYNIQKQHTGERDVDYYAHVSIVGPVPNRVEMRKAHSSGGRSTTESPPCGAVGGMRHGQAYQEAGGC